MDPINQLEHHNIDFWSLALLLINTIYDCKSGQEIKYYKIFAGITTCIHVCIRIYFRYKLNINLFTLVARVAATRTIKTLAIKQ